MTELPEAWLRQWERRAVPTWGIGPDMRIRFLNRRAEEVLGVTAAEAIGKPCHEVVRGREGSGKAFCCPGCPVFAAAQTGTDLRPEIMRLGSRKSKRWSQVLPIVVDAPDGSGPILVESAVDVDRWARIESYVKRIAERDPARHESATTLTRRETEVLGLLAEGFSQPDIAKRLRVHYTTVRTHVQRILAKLGVHSVDAAIAHHLLGRSAEE